MQDSIVNINGDIVKNRSPFKIGKGLLKMIAKYPVIEIQAEQDVGWKSFFVYLDRKFDWIATESDCAIGETQTELCDLMKYGITKS